MPAHGAGPHRRACEQDARSRPPVPVFVRRRSGRGVVPVTVAPNVPWVSGARDSSRARWPCILRPRARPAQSHDLPGDGPGRRLRARVGRGHGRRSHPGRGVRSRARPGACAVFARVGRGRRALGPHERDRDRAPRARRRNVVRVRAAGAGHAGGGSHRAARAGHGPGRGRRGPRRPALRAAARPAALRGRSGRRVGARPGARPRAPAGARRAGARRAGLRARGERHPGRVRQPAPAHASGGERVSGLRWRPRAGARGGRGPHRGRARGPGHAARDGAGSPARRTTRARGRAPGAAVDARGLPAGRAPGPGAGGRGRDLSGRAVAALRGPAPDPCRRRGPPRSVPHVAGHEPGALHVPAGAAVGDLDWGLPRGPGAGRARPGRPTGAARGHGAAHRGHAPPGGEPGPGSGAVSRTAGRPQGARGAPDAGRFGAQRRGPHRHARLGPGPGVVHRGALLSGHAHRVRGARAPA